MAQLRRALTDAERLDWLRLIRTENVGPVTFFRLLDRYDTVSAALKALPDLAHRGGRTAPLRIPSRAEAEREVAANTRIGARLIAACEPDYPVPLAHIDDAPPIVSVLGHPHLLKKRAIAMVGARNASLNGRRFAEKLARDLGEAGFLVVSGLARGIDTSAHVGALEAGTAAVVAGGIDIVYPEENRGLYQQIAERGVIIAESPIGTQPQARHFPRRNRIISGLSVGIVVVEAALKSGSLITARMAGEQGRDVFAVPGSPMDPRAGGTNQLLRDGAQLTETVDDIILNLTDSSSSELREPQGDLFAPAPAMHLAIHLDDNSFPKVRDLIVECLGPSPVPVDELVRGCQLSASVVRSVLLELEVAGRVQWQPGNQVVLIQQ